MARTVTINGDDHTDFIRLESLVTVEAAYGGEVGQGGFIRSDDGSDWVPAMKDIQVDEDEASPSLMFDGFIGVRGLDRGQQARLVELREFDVTILDLNTVLDDEVFQADGANRPEETDYERVTWLLTTSAISALSITAGVVPNTNTKTMEARDYRGEGPRSVLDECSEAAEKNYFIYNHGDGRKLYYDLATGTSLSSSMRITTVLADVDNETTWAWDDTPKLDIDPSRIYSTVRFKYDGGVVWVTDTDIETTYRRREFGMEDLNVHSATKARERASAFLASVSAELHTYTGSVSVPAANVNDILNGQRFQTKIPHLTTPDIDLDSWHYMRIRRIEKTPQNNGTVSAERYTINLEFSDDLRPVNFGGGGGGGEDGTTTETAAELTRYQLRHERGAGPFGPDVLLGTEFYSVDEDFDFDALGTLSPSLVTRMPEANVPWEFTACGLGEGAVAGLTTREAWYKFTVDLATNSAGVSFTIDPFIVVDDTGDYNDSPSGEIVGAHTVICGVHTGADPTDEGQYTELARIGDGGGFVTIPADMLVDGTDNWFVMAPGWEISDTNIYCIPDPHPWGWGDAGDDTNTIVTASTLTHFDSTAEQISFDNTESGLTATNVQDALDELTLAAAAVPPLEDVLGVGNTVGGNLIQGDPGAAYGYVDVDASHGSLSYVGAGGIHEFVADDDGISIRDGTGSHGSAGQVLTAVGDDYATWEDATGGGSPTGSAGGDLSGTYPNPDVVNDSHSHTLATLETPTLAEVLAEGNLVGGEVISGDPVGGFAGEVVLDDTQARMRYVDGSGEADIAAASTVAFMYVTTGGPTYGFGVGPGGPGVTDVSGASGDADQVFTALGDGTAVWADPTGGPPTGAAGGDLSGTYPNPSVVNSSHDHDATTAPGDPHTALRAVDFLVGTATAELSAEIVVGTSPGGELGGTWASPTVDATHSGSAHHDPVTVGTGLDVTGQLVELDLSEVAAGGELGGFMDAPTVDATHAGSTHIALSASEPGAVSTTGSGTAGTGTAASKDDHSHDLGFDDATADPSAIGSVADGTATSAARKDHVHATGAGTPSTQAFGDAASTGTGPAASMTDHKHAMPANPVTGHEAAADPHTGYVLESLLDAKGDLIAASADNTPAKLTVGADDTILMADSAAGAGLKWVASATPSTQAMGDAAAVGTSDTFTRGDHKHAMPTATMGGDLAGSYPNPTVAKVTNSLTLAGVISPTQLVANTDNWNPTGLSTATVINVDIDANRDLTGIDATGVADGRVLILRNISAFRLTLKSDATSTAANRFKLAQSRDLFVPTFNQVVLTYNNGQSRWNATGMTQIATAAPNAIGTAAAGTAANVSASDHVHATGAGTPSTQAFADAASTGTGPAASMTDHKHAMPALGYGLSGTATAVVGLSTAEAFATATTSISASTYADVTGASVSLAAGTWLVLATIVGSCVTTTAGILVGAITHSDNTVLAEASQGAPAGTATVAQNMSVTLSAIVTPGTTTTYKLRAARGTTTYTSTIVIMDGSGVNTANNTTNNSDKGTSIRAVRIA